MDLRNFLIGTMICFFFTAVFFANYQDLNGRFGAYSNSRDYFFHEAIVRGECVDKIVDCVSYPSVYHWVFSLFDDSFYFFLANLLMIFFVFPMVILLYVKHWLGPLAYFSVGFSYASMFAGTFSSTFFFLLLFVAALLFSRGNRFWAGVAFGIAILSHSKALIVVGGLLAAYWIYWKYFRGVDFSPSILAPVNPGFLSVGIEMLIKIFPFPFLLVPLIHPSENQKLFSVWILFFLAFSFIDARVFWYATLIFPFMAIEFAGWLNGWKRSAFVVFLAAVCLFHLIYWPDYAVRFMEQFGPFVPNVDF